MPRVVQFGVLLACALAAVGPGCGGDDEPEPKRSQADERIERRIEELDRRRQRSEGADGPKRGGAKERSTRRRSRSPRRTAPASGWCAEGKGRAFLSLGRPIRQAYAKRDALRLRTLTDRALRLAEDAPRREPCAVLQLGQLALFWNSGQVRKAAGVSPEAQSKRVLEFAASHDLDRARY